MKIIDPNVPPELESRYKELVSTTATVVVGLYYTRTSKVARRVKRGKKPSILKQQLHAAVGNLLTLLGLKPGSQAWNDRRYLEEQKLLDGYFDPEYFVKREPVLVDYFTCAPVNIPDPDPPPYAFRSPSNLPSKVTYPAGTPDAAPICYEGQLVGSYFHDTKLTWARYMYGLSPLVRKNEEGSVFWDWWPTFTVTTDARGSRSMFSALSSLRLTGPTGSPLTDDTPPTTNKESYYYRYYTPARQTPPYATEMQRHVVGSYRKDAFVDAPVEASNAVLIVSPRPMMGRGNNNCTTVTTFVTGEPRLYQLKPCLGKYAAPTYQTSGLKIGYLDLHRQQAFLSELSRPSDPSYAQMHSAAGVVAFQSSNGGNWCMEDQLASARAGRVPWVPEYISPAFDTHPEGFCLKDIMQLPGDAPTHYSLFWAVYNPWGDLLTRHIVPHLPWSSSRVYYGFHAGWNDADRPQWQYNQGWREDGNIVASFVMPYPAHGAIGHGGGVWLRELVSIDKYCYKFLPFGATTFSVVLTPNLGSEHWSRAPDDSIYIHSYDGTGKVKTYNLTSTGILEHVATIGLDTVSFFIDPLCIS